MVNQPISHWRDDDDSLLAALDRALHPVVDVPASFLQKAHDCYTLYLEAELAALAYDSAADGAELAILRAPDEATLRTLTFEATNVTFELEVMPDGLAGQLILTTPPAGRLQLLSNQDEIIDIPTNVDGYFRIRPTPSSPFRLRCQLDDGHFVTTDPIVL